MCKRSMVIVFLITVVVALSAGMAMAFGEAPGLSKMVAEGKLPPVEERLPETPLVVDHIDAGKYGGMLVCAVDNEFQGFNWYGASAGKVLTWIYEPLLYPKNPERVRYTPNLASEYEISDDGRQISFTLRKGIKWSDGVEFTTDDIAFTYNDIVLDRNIPLDRWWARSGGELGELVVEDKYNFRFVFAEPNPTFLDWICKLPVFPIMAKHEMAQYHPRYNDSANYETWASSRGFNSSDVTLSAWTLESGSSTTITMKRNPYYWKVDPEGNQLPYIDTLRLRGYTDRQALSMSIISGDTQVGMDGMSAETLPTALQQQDSRPFTVMLRGLGWSASGPMFNFDAPDPNLQKLFREKKFIQAIKYGTNREQIQAAMPLVDVLHGVYPIPGSAYYSEELAARHSYEFDPVKANELLDELGLVDTDGDGLRDFPADYPNPGKTVGFQILTGNDHPARLTAFEILAKQYQENLGIKAQMKAVPGTLLFQAWPYGEWDVWGRWAVMDSVWDEPLKEARTFGVVGTTQDDTPRFHAKGALVDPMDWEIEVGELLIKATTIVDPEERREVIWEALDLFAEYAPMDQTFVEKLWHGVPDEELIGNCPYHMWDTYTPGRGSHGHLNVEIENWYWKK